MWDTTHEAYFFSLKVTPNVEYYRGYVFECLLKHHFKETCKISVPNIQISEKKLKILFIETFGLKNYVLILML